MWSIPTVKAPQINVHGVHDMCVFNFRTKFIPNHIDLPATANVSPGRPTSVYIGQQNS